MSLLSSCEQPINDGALDKGTDNVKGEGDGRTSCLIFTHSAA